MPTIEAPLIYMISSKIPPISLVWCISTWAQGREKNTSVRNNHQIDADNNICK
jgi:hypothetical protein